MVNMTLNLQLTDEQYANLMTRSFDTIMEDPEVVDKLKNVIIAGMRYQIESVIKDKAPDAIKFVYGLKGYNFTSTSSSFMEEVVKEASQDFQNKIKDTIQNVMCDMAEQSDVGAIIYKILAACIMEGATAGIKRWQELVFLNSSEVHECLQNINMILGAAGRPIDAPIPGVIPPETPQTAESV